MADSAALYGLIGAIGGALLGAGAAATAPILQFKGAERLRRRSLADAEIERLIALRRTTRDVLAVLTDGVGALESGGPLNARTFRRELTAALEQVEVAADEVAAHGLVVLVSGGSQHRDRSRPQPSLTRRRARQGRALAPLTQEQRTLIPFIRETGEAIHAVALSRNHDSESLPLDTSGLRLRAQQAERIRGELTLNLLDRMEALRNF